MDIRTPVYREDFEDELNIIWDLAISFLSQKSDFVLTP